MTFAPEVLLYHRVAQGGADNQYLSVSPENFEAHLDILCRKRKVIPLFDLVQAGLKGQLLEKAVAITFDDGYADNLLNALPILEKYRCHATIFVTAALLGHPYGFWYDVLEDVLLSGRPLPPALKLDTLSEPLPLSSAEALLASHDILLDICKKAPARVRRVLMHQVVEAAGMDPLTYHSPHPVLTEEQVATLAASPYIEIGAHTLTHPVLALLDEANQRREITESAQILEKLTHKPTRILAYPFGNSTAYNDISKKVCREAGLLGIANIQGSLVLHEGTLDPQDVPRRLVRNWSGQDFDQWLHASDRHALERKTVGPRAEILLQKLGSGCAVHASAPDSLRLEPVSRRFGLDRGTAIDRVYIEQFLATHKASIGGRVLEIADNTYTQRFGTGVTQSDVLNAVPTAGATMIGSLTDAGLLPAQAFDCIILTQTLHVIYDIKSVLHNVGKALAPGGSLLLTAPCISQISRYDMDRWGDYWRFTNAGLQHLLQECMPQCTVDVEAHGNFAVASAFLDGKCAEEIPSHFWQHRDKDYQVLLTAKVTRTTRSAVVTMTGTTDAKPAQSAETKLKMPASHCYYPTQLAIEPIHGCNANCIMCPQKQAQRPKGILKTSHHSLMLEKIRQWGAPIRIISHAGLGEPLLDKELEKKILRDKAVFPKADVTVYSNAALLDSERAKALLDTGVDCLSFSLNALDPERYKKITGLDQAKSYSNVLHLLELCEKYNAKTRIHVSCIPIPELPPEEIVAFRKFWQKKAHAVMIPPYINWGGDLGDANPGLSTRLPCNYIFSVLMVDWDGTVKRCCEDYDSKYPMGNLLTQEPNDIFNSRMMTEQRRTQCEGCFKAPHICQRCVETAPEVAGPFWVGGGPVPC